MLKLSLYSLMALIISSILGFSLANAQAMKTGAVPGEFIIKMRSSLKVKGQAKSAQDTQILNAKLNGKAQLKKSLAAGFHQYKALKPAETQQIMQDLKSHPDVEYVEPNFYLQQSPDDSIFANQQADQYIYSFDDVSAQSTIGTYIQSLANFGVTQAWSILSDVDSRPIVAVIDTGVDISHQVFSSTGSIWVNAAEIPNNGIDDDGNGLIDDYNGWNFNTHNSNVFDDQGHGTHVAGIVQGVGQDLFAVSLTPSKIRIMPLKFMDSTGTGTTADAIAAIYYAANMGAKVINNSWGGGNYSQGLHDALTYAYSKGIMIASAAGNYAHNNDINPIYPANLPIPGSLSVAATTDTDILASFSSYGPLTVDVAAPGVSILSTYPGNSYRYMSGTSMATPMVAGLAALIARESPLLTGFQIKQKIMSSSDLILNLKDRLKSQGRIESANTIVNTKADISVQSYQPVYVATPPPGAVDESVGMQKSVGCGTVSVLTNSVGRSAAEFSRNLRYHPSDLFVYALILLAPLLAWAVTRMKLVSRPRRAHDRFVLQSEVKIKVGGRELTGNLNTIGVGGVSFDVDAMIARGGQVNLTITGPDGQEQIHVLGRVVWSEKSQSYGVQFAPLRESLVERIRTWSSGLMKAA